MSQENVEIVKQAYEAEAGRDFEALHALYDPRIEMDFSNSPFGDFADPAVARLAEVRRTFRDFYAAFANVESDVHEVIVAGEEWKGMAGLWAFREGKITRVDWLPSRELALEAVGLPE